MGYLRLKSIAKSDAPYNGLSAMWLLRTSMRDLVRQPGENSSRLLHRRSKRLRFPQQKRQLPYASERFQLAQPFYDPLRSLAPLHGN